MVCHNSEKLCFVTPLIRRIISLFNKVIFLFWQPHHTLRNPTSLEILLRKQHTVHIRSFVSHAVRRTSPHRNTHTHTHHINNLEKLFNLLLRCLYYNVLLCQCIIHHSSASSATFVTYHTISQYVHTRVYSNSSGSPFHIIAHQSTHDKALSLSSCFMLLYQKGNIFIT